jgi:hypothetical protein
MNRMTPFDRDYRDLHGRKPQPEFIRHEDVRRGRIISRIPKHAGLRLSIGALGLFWAPVLLVALCALAVVIWAFASSAFAPPLYPYG